jgi:hypothetical protein
MFSCASDRNPCCGPNSAATRIRACGETVGDVPQLAVDRCRVADHPDPAPGERAGLEQSLRSKDDAHFGEIIVPAHM